MNKPPTTFFNTLNDFTYIITIIILILTQVLLRKFFPDSFIIGSTLKTLSDLLFNGLLSLCLFGFFIKKYNPDSLRKIFMGIFLGELVLGTWLKNMQLSYYSEIIVIGFLGILLTWFNTHSNRKKFISKQH